MSHFDRTFRAQFYLTSQRDCPYLPGRRERKLFTTLIGPDAAQLHDDLAAHGFRRSQNIVYRPACAGCSACYSTRVCAQDFSPTRSQRRVAKRNADLVRQRQAAWASEEQHALFDRYLAARHAEGGMADMDATDFAAMIEDSTIDTHVVEYRLPSEENRLVAACLTDRLRDGLSLVYSFFDPDLDRRSLGQFIILDHIEQARETALPYVYLGYWVPGSEKMDYKTRFRPCEILDRRQWRRIEPE